MIDAIDREPGLRARPGVAWLGADPMNRSAYYGGYGHPAYSYSGALRVAPSQLPPGQDGELLHSLTVSGSVAAAAAVSVKRTALNPADRCAVGRDLGTT